MKMSTEEMFPDVFKKIHAHEEANRSEPGWFAQLPPGKLNACMSEYPFTSFDDIPEDNSDLQYPSLEKIAFYLPSWMAPRYRLPDNVRKELVITTVDGFSLLSSLEVQAFNIDPRR